MKYNPLLCVFRCTRCANLCSLNQIDERGICRGCSFCVTAWTPLK